MVNLEIIWHYDFMEKKSDFKWKCIQEEKSQHCILKKKKIQKPYIKFPPFGFVFWKKNIFNFKIAAHRVFC